MVSSMSLIRIAIPMCVCFWLVIREGQSYVYLNPLVEEGTSYVMNCTTTLRLNQWSLEWRIRNKTSVDCSVANGCHNTELKRYNMTVEDNGIQTISFLNISQVSLEDEGLVFECNVYEIDGPKSEKVGVWNMSRVYSLPSPSMTKCGAVFRDVDTIFLTCKVFNVHPSIVCEPFQNDNGIKTALNGVMEYIKSENKTYTCSVIIAPACSVAYNISMDIKLDITFQRGNITPPVCSKYMTIKSNTTLEVYPISRKIALCQGREEPITVKCQLLCWFSPKWPVISWYLDNNLIEANISTIVIDIQNSSFESQYNFPPSSNKYKKSLKCSAGNYSNDTVNFTADIQLIWPPVKLQMIVYTTNRTVNQTLSRLVEGERLNVQCAMEGGQQPMGNLTVVCCNSSLCDVTKNKSANKIEVFFIFPKYSYCSCSVQHISECKIPSANISFARTRPHKLKSDVINYVTYSIGAAFVVVGVCVVVAFIVYWKTDYRKEFGFGFFRMSELRNHTLLKSITSDASGNGKWTSSHESTNSKVYTEPYSVVDIVSQNIADICDGGNVSTESSAYIHLHSDGTLPQESLPSRRPLPALPPSTHDLVEATEEVAGLNGIEISPDFKRVMSRRFHSGNVQYEECVPYEDPPPPPLPPKPNLIAITSPMQEIPVFVKDGVINENIQWQRYTPPTKNSAHKSFSIPNSESTQRLPPKLCGHRSRSINRKQSSKYKYAVDKTSEFDGALFREEGSPVFNPDDGLGNSFNNGPTKLSNLWPPPPIRARKPASDKQKLRKSSEESAQMDTSNMSESHTNLDVNTANNTHRHDVFNVYANVKTNVHTSE